MAAGEDGVYGDHGSETSTETTAATEVEAASTASNAGSNSSGFASSVLPGVREASRKLQLKMNFRTLSSPKRYDKNEPSRFMGEGVSFKAKLIGILEVAEARGDRMCQDALADLKMAIRAAGEHKQRITINIAIDGLRLRDEKTGDCLYHHLVHKISFIAQDMTDPRAFGYIFGSPDTGHRFFGIKTDKAASQVVECIRDLFQVVFALKNREQHIEQQHVKVCGGSTSNLASATSSTPSVTYMEAMAHHLKDCSRVSPLETFRQASLADQFDVFTELDPLDLKNPPKKVLKDLVGEPGSPAPSSAPLFQASFDSGSRDSAGPQTQAGALGDVLSALETAPGSSTSYPSFPDPFSDDPFDKTDPFAEGSFSQTVSFSPNTVIPDPFESGSRNSASPLPSAALGGSGGTGAVHGPLRVSLPPEDGAAAASSCLSPSPPLTGSLSKQRSRFTRKQLSVSLVKIPSPKSSQRRSRLPKQMTVDGSPGVRFPTPPLDEAPPSSQRRSPGGLSRGVITPSPPIVASFPDLDGDAGSRLSGSSAELAEIAPEPPPRPAPNAFSIKPPPLPPKKHTGAIFKPPPRPPHQDDPHSIYDHIENYESSSSPTPHDLADAKSPPIPVPARKPRYGDDGSVPLRPKKQAVLAETEDGYLAPIPFLPPPVKRSSSQSQQRKAGHGHGQGQAASGPGKKSLDITLSQLTKTGFTDLASTLGISPSQLSKMTLQDLTKRLAGLSEPGAQQPAAQGDGFTAGNRHSLSKAEYTALRESVDEDSGFAAEFDDNFCNIGSAAAPSASAVNQESLYDKYAVFRELLLQDEPGGGLSSSELEETNLSTTQGESADSLQEEGPVDMGAPSSVPHSSPITISVVAQPDSPATSVATAMSSASASASASPSPAQALVDRYAALREISLCDESSNKDDDERDEDNNGYAEVENESDKDDSITEVIRDAMQVQDEDQDLLTLSAQHSESTESPTLDTNAVRDAPSIMETTILEEDGCTSEGDASERLADQAMPPLSKNSLLDSSIASLEPVPENLELASVSATLIPGLTNGSGVESGAVAAAPAAGAQPGDQSARPHSLEPNKSPGEAWAKFDSSHFEKPVSDEGASPWSSDGKEFGGKVTGWKDDSDHERRDRDRGRRRRPNRGHGPASASTAGPPSGPPGPGPAAWAEDEESEEGWDDRVSDDLWENGFEEGQGRGRYPEPRRSRRRKVSPWRRGSSRDREASPWESGDSAGPPPPGQEDMKRSWKTRPKNRGSSWEEERMQRGGGPGSTGPGSVGGPGSTRGSWDGDGSEYEDARKRRQSPWGEDRDRDRERRHAWEEDERYRREGWEWYYRGTGTTAATTATTTTAAGGSTSGTGSVAGTATGTTTGTGGPGRAGRPRTTGTETATGTGTRPGTTSSASRATTTATDPRPTAPTPPCRTRGSGGARGPGARRAAATSGSRPARRWSTRRTTAPARPAARRVSGAAATATTGSTGTGSATGTGTGWAAAWTGAPAAATTPSARTKSTTTGSATGSVAASEPAAGRSATPATSSARRPCTRAAPTARATRPTTRPRRPSPSRPSSPPSRTTSRRSGSTSCRRPSRARPASARRAAWTRATPAGRRCPPRCPTCSCPTSPATRPRPDTEGCGTASPSRRRPRRRRGARRDTGTPACR
ncbi:hypothetical protein ONE63_010666 [Megalurothrips usitatus]|uniref:PID domain-containing protein n=1 Tax=Megalurothrips usitatus TaxID=439358 RepID=A0AAV7XGP7_9NEOP|nr:hypothetical protein ONE63_010666 [Megalurothrips usitatus]